MNMSTYDYFALMKKNKMTLRSNIYRKGGVVRVFNVIIYSLYWLSFFFLVTSYAVVSRKVRLFVIMKMYYVSMSCFAGANLLLFCISEWVSASFSYDHEVA